MPDSFLYLLPSGSCSVYELIVKEQSETRLKKLTGESNRKKSFIEMKKVQLIHQAALLYSREFFWTPNSLDSGQIKEQ